MSHNRIQSILVSVVLIASISSCKLRKDSQTQLRNVSDGAASGADFAPATLQLTECLESN